MLVTRRSLLRTLAALPAVCSLRAFADDYPMCPTTPAPATSAFIFLEGPWLIFPTANNTLTALSMDASQDQPCTFSHLCEFSEWHSGNPIPNSIEPVVPGVPWNGRASSHGNFDQVFDDAFTNRQKFIWAEGERNVVPKGGERSIVLTVPTAVHIAGILTHVTASAPGNYLRQSGVKAHVTTILQYNQPVSLTHTGKTKQIGLGYQGVFAMYHDGSDPEAPHIQMGFQFLKDRLPSSPPDFKLSDIPDTFYTCGDSLGFSNEQLGLYTEPFARLHKQIPEHKPDATTGPVCLMNFDYANCCGGTIVTGGH
jgi:hypothetical protein